MAGGPHRNSLPSQPGSSPRLLATPALCGRTTAGVTRTPHARRHSLSHGRRFLPRSMTAERATSVSSVPLERSGGSGRRGPHDPVIASPSRNEAVSFPPRRGMGIARATLAPGLGALFFKTLRPSRSTPASKTRTAALLKTVSVTASVRPQCGEWSFRDVGKESQQRGFPDERGR